jgi:transposase
MIGRRDRSKRSFFIAGDIEQFIPDAHILKRVDRILDLNWLSEAVKECYCADNGRPSIDPEAAVRLMLAGFFQGIVHDRKLLREAQVNIAIRWFAGYELDETLPDHSSLSRIRERWGADKFRAIFTRTVQTCIDKGLVSGETVHVDSTLIRADVSWESIVTKHANEVIRENREDHDDEKGLADPPKKVGRPRTRENKPKKISLTDPEATMATSSRNHYLEPTYKQHTAVDDQSGILIDVDLTTGEVNEGTKLIETIARIECITEKPIKHVTADKGYAHSVNYGELDKRGIDAVIPPQRESHVGKGNLSIRRFKYDGLHQRLVCPGGKVLTQSSRGKKGWFYKSKRSDCRCCHLCRHCLPPTAKTRTILIVDGYESLLRARRRKLNGWDDPTKRLYNRHRYLVEGIHGEAKMQHGLRRAVRRGLENVAIQVYLTAVVINLKRLAIASSGTLRHWFYIMNRLAMNIYKALSSFGTEYPFSVRSLYIAA